MDADTERQLDQVEVLATGDAREDLEAVRAFVDRFRSSPRQISASDLHSSVSRMDRLLLWAISVCPPPQRPVWGCATQIAHASGDPFAATYSRVVGKLVPSEAIDDAVGEVVGDRLELARSANRVVYGWVDGLGLVRRRVEVRRIIDLWFVTDSKRCDEPSNRPHPLDTSEVIVEELPDGADGPEWEPTVPEEEEEADDAEEVEEIDESGVTEMTMSPTVPLMPCRWDPSDPNRQFETLGEYMAHGPAENGCWSLLTAEGRSCVNDPPSGEFFACFDL